MSDKVRVLFVCLGNICRSPTAEGVFQQAVDAAGMQTLIEVDSCGTGSWHVGKAPDSRAIEAARRRGIDISHLRARQFQPNDLTQFDYILVMDRQNLADVKDLWHRDGGTEPRLFLEFANTSGSLEVPDPYFGGVQGFERVLDLIESASQGLIATIREKQA
ncbi:low molecular weight protein-tyrosine-phosphatase [Marinobacter sp. SS21]|uniref:low molecular weight protein-tyrosine-phosphatase n=1 Tax=Marinobacter sp. SS21 TaxID=2979460 RepID=UPI00232ECF19|nr:low molecular weight protein-tyrosine-phosphatase [Marinobacter sp. SS21]MDC0662006.1 low molecular weight phosphotyrosine protein phosphatase [Marinobacter sp. SS21]